ncbi:fructokinase [Firmicutes bacterium CAG:791]|nr:fructokinase [Firmicutes bacterium CAG:791]
MIDIAAVGEIVIDFTPISNAKNGNLRYEAQPGGAPSNLLAEATLLGASTQLIGVVGNDPLGEFLCKIAERYGFGGAGLKKIDTRPTPFTLVSFDASGDRSFYSVQTESALHAFEPEMINKEILQQARAIHLAGSLLGMENGRRIFDQVKSFAIAQGKLVNCDVNWRPGSYQQSEARKYILPHLRGLDLLKVSFEEMRMLTDVDDVEIGSQALMDEGIRLICITMGEDGCYFRYKNGDGYVPAYHVEVVDTNAAGDVFTAAVLVSLLKQNCDISQIDFSKMHEIMSIANAASGICVSRKGAIYAAPTLEDVQSFLSNVGVSDKTIHGTIGGVQ